MFWEILRTLIRIAVVFFFLILAFGLSFFVLLGSQVSWMAQLTFYHYKYYLWINNFKRLFRNFIVLWYFLDFFFLLFAANIQHAIAFCNENICNDARRHKLSWCISWSITEQWIAVSIPELHSSHYIYLAYSNPSYELASK